MRAAVKPSHTQNAVDRASCMNEWWKYWLDKKLTCANTNAVKKLTTSVIARDLAAPCDIFLSSSFTNSIHMLPNTGLAYHIEPTIMLEAVASSTAHQLIAISI